MISSFLEQEEFAAFSRVDRRIYGISRRPESKPRRLGLSLDQTTRASFKLLCEQSPVLGLHCLALRIHCFWEASRWDTMIPLLNAHFVRLQELSLHGRLTSRLVLPGNLTSLRTLYLGYWLGVEHGLDLSTFSNLTSLDVCIESLAAPLPSSLQHLSLYAHDTPIVSIDRLQLVVPISTPPTYVGLTYLVLCYYDPDHLTHFALACPSLTSLDCDILDDSDSLHWLSHMKNLTSLSTLRMISRTSLEVVCSLRPSIRSLVLDLEYSTQLTPLEQLKGLDCLHIRSCHSSDDIVGPKDPMPGVTRVSLPPGRRVRGDWAKWFPNAVIC